MGIARRIASAGLLIAIVGVVLVVFMPGPDPLGGLAAACRGDGVTRAGVYTPGQGPNHLVIIRGASVDSWTRRMPAEWVPVSIEAAELVACVPGEPTLTQVETCSYTGGTDVTRYRASVDVRIVEARTAAQLAIVPLVGEPDACRASERADVTRIDGTINYAQLSTTLLGIVSKGSAVRPGPGPSNAGVPVESTLSPATSGSPAVAETPAPTPVRMELIKAVTAGDVDIKATGNSLQALDLSIASNVNFDLEIVINPGTVFEPGSGSVQTMVVVARQTVEIEAKLDVEVELDVACADMTLDTPGGSDAFSLRTGSVPKEIVKLTRLDGFATLDFRVQQFAIWTITNNPTRNGYVGLGSFGVGSGPTDEELARVRELFKEAGINPDRYRSLKAL
jgi:hypothetical protein